MAEDKRASKKEGSALEVPGRRKWTHSSSHSQRIERPLANKKHQDSRNYLPKDGNDVTKGTASQQQLLLMSKFSKNKI